MSVVIHVTLLKKNMMQKLDGINIITQLIIQNHQNKLEKTPTISNALKNVKNTKNLEASNIALWKPDLNE